MSRTTTVDTAPTSDVDEQIVTPPDGFIKRGTSPFMRVTLALFSAGLATFCPPLLRTTHTACAFARVWCLSCQQ
ncbi:Permeases of the major facilitator superfamily [Citrobacter freundii]|uniref:Permeases of the major facilitator superfamily n=1 Tax=Citrobacter freundii TaxID=546 RepID=A0A7G2IY58_CITFR|nr:Permeases of the major facilitator superfamily [Citrobacter freundii]